MNTVIFRTFSSHLWLLSWPAVYAASDATVSANAFSTMQHTARYDSVAPVHLLILCPLWNLMNRYLGFCSLFCSKHFLLATKKKKKPRLCSIGALQELMSLLISEPYRNATVYHAESSCHTRSYGTCSCHNCLALEGSHKSLDSCSKSELVKSSWNLKPGGLVQNPAPVFVHSPTGQKKL